ncbi:type II secretion system F family protein [Halobacillus litoralis]|uniref:type II secretion system F family protein n=1 Tax=Halobacillus litoralis TaxID=45668 RepID=UPI001CD32033|nr:type II secretion system F family protein [Halobacillus litoralis]MCA0970099.1 type II secretion system F family protein [Halobacillus litoralis]
MPLGTSKLPTWIKKKPPRLPADTQILFFHRLNHILSKGYPLLDALSMTSWDPKLSQITRTISIHLKEGLALDQAFQKTHFSPVVITFLFFGQNHFDLTVTFKQCELILEMRETNKKKLIHSLRYPILLFIFVLLAFSVIQRSILPNFMMLFNDGSTLWLIKGLSLLIDGLGLTAAVLTVTWISWLFVSPRLSTNQLLSIVSSIPYIRHGYALTLSFSFTTHIQTLLAAGLTLKDALVLMRNQSHQRVLSKYSEQILSGLQDGKTAGQSIYPCTLLREEVTNIFHQAHDNEALKGELELLSDFYMDYMETTLAKWLQRVQPIFFLLIALLVVLIYASIMLPLYQWMDQM